METKIKPIYKSNKKDRKQKYNMISSIIVTLLMTMFLKGLALSFTSTSNAQLSKKSTALDVLKYLNNSDRLAPYAKKNYGGTVVVTGGNSGIGAISVEVLALSGMNVVLCARDEVSAEEQREKMTAKEKVRIQKLDLTDFKSIEEAIEEIKSKEGSIDLLLLNAGVMATPYQTTKEGFELQIGTNHIAHHYMTRLLLPSMNAGGRVVSVASTAHSFGDIDYSDINYKNGRKYTPWGAYGQSKLANILFAKGLDDRLKESGSDIQSVSLHPGVIKTNLWRYSNPLFQIATNLIADKNTEQGAATNVFSSLVESSFFKGGEYCMDCAITNPNAKAQDRDERKKLWTLTEKLIAEQGVNLPEKLI